MPAVASYSVFLSIRPSGVLAAGVTLLHCGAAALVGFSAMPLAFRFAAIAVVAASLAWTLYRHVALQPDDAIVRLESGEDDGLTATLRHGGRVRCEVLPTTFVSPLITVLNLKPAGGRRSRHVVVVPGSVDSRQFRRLRVRLRWLRTVGRAMPGN